MKHRGLLLNRLSDSLKMVLDNISINDILSIKLKDFIYRTLDTNEVFDEVIRLYFFINTNESIKSNFNLFKESYQLLKDNTSYKSLINDKWKVVSSKSKNLIGVDDEVDTIVLTTLFLKHVKELS